MFFAKKKNLVVFTNEEKKALLTAVFKEDVKSVGHLFSQYELPGPYQHRIDDFFKKEGLAPGYDFERMHQLIAHHKGSLFDSVGSLKAWVGTATSMDSFAHLNQLLWDILQLSLTAVFDANGEIKSWVKKGLGKEYYQQVEVAICPTALKFKLLQEYIHLFCGYVAKRDNEAHNPLALVVIALLAFERTHLQSISKRLQYLEQYLASSQAKASFFYDELNSLSSFFHQIFFRKKVGNYQNFFDVIDLVIKQMEAPEDKAITKALKRNLIKNEDMMPCWWSTLLLGFTLFFASVALFSLALLSMPLAIPSLLFAQAITGVVGIFVGLYFLHSGWQTPLKEKGFEFLIEIEDWQARQDKIKTKKTARVI